MPKRNDTIQAAIALLAEEERIAQVSFRNFEVCEYSSDNPLPIKIEAPINEDRVRRFKASDDTLDHYEEVILASGWKFNLFKKNGPVMQFHDYHSWPIGKGIGVGIIDDALFVDSEFDPPEVDESADLVLRKIDHGTIKAGSVGFIPIKSVRPTSTESDKELKVDELFEKYPGARKIYVEQELLEWTICPIGANPNALAASLRDCLALRYGLEPDQTAEISGLSADDRLAVEEKLEGINKVLA